MRLLLDGISMVMSVEVVVPGSGQTRSLTSSRRYSLILSKRYLCHSSESPVGAIGGGLSTQDGNHTPRSGIRCSSSAVAVFLRKSATAEEEPLDGPARSGNDGTV